MAGGESVTDNQLLNPSEPAFDYTPDVLRSKIVLDEDRSTRDSLVGSSLEGVTLNPPDIEYEVLHKRWMILGMFVIYSASNSMQWTQYTIIQDIVVKYYGVSSNLVSWTSMVFMVTYVPLIFPASWYLDQTVLKLDSPKLPRLAGGLVSEILGVLSLMVLPTTRFDLLEHLKYRYAATPQLLEPNGRV